MLRYLTAGESHGPQLTAIIDGLPAGLQISSEKINHQLSRRQKGYGRGGRMRIETDKAQVLSGIRHGKTIGGPVTLVIENKDWENWERIMDPFLPIPDDLSAREVQMAKVKSCPRPGHADLPGGVKWNHHDLRNVLERASARETAARVALGAIARQALELFGIDIVSHVVRIGHVALENRGDRINLAKLRQITEESEVRCLDPETGEQMIQAIKAAKAGKDSLGGVVEVIVEGLPVGLGGLSQWNDRLDSKLAGALMGVHSVKGVEIGLGFDAAKRLGSTVHDQIYFKKTGNQKRKGFYRKTNNAGGLEGGISNGEDIVLRVASKPISTLNQPLSSVDVNTKESSKAMVERTDNCVIPALGVICEAVTALVLAEVFFAKFGSDNFDETKRNFEAFLSAEY